MLNPRLLFEPISDFREELSDADLHQPAAVDDNHIVFYNEDDKHVEVMNMIPKHHLDTLHKNPSKETRFIKYIIIYISSISYCKWSSSRH